MQNGYVGHLVGRKNAARKEDPGKSIFVAENTKHRHVMVERLDPAANDFPEAVTSR
jgi:short subunit dehydrogenase-like uncharacterized protein